MGAHCMVQTCDKYLEQSFGTRWLARQRRDVLLLRTDASAVLVL